MTHHQGMYTYSTVGQYIYCPSFVRSEEEKEERRQLALQTILTRPPQILIDAIGRETFTNNTALLVEGLQNQFLAKHMLFSMLDIVVCELFPELKV